MSDAFDSAAADIEQQRRAAVAAIAANGSAGAQALADANSQIGSLRAQALQGALANAATRGVPTAAQNELTGIINRPYDLLGASTSQMAASNAQRQAALSGAVGAYFPQLAAAVPLARTQLQTKIALADAAKAAKEKELSDSELRTRLLGAGQNEQDQAIQDALHGHHETQTQLEALQHLLGTFKASRPFGSTFQKNDTGALGPLGPQGPGGQYTVSSSDRATAQHLEQQIADARRARDLTTVAVKQTKSSTPEDYARQAGLASGLDPNLVAGLIPREKPKTLKPEQQIAAVSDAAHAAGIKPKLLQSIIKPSTAEQDPTWFERASKQAEAAVKSGIPLETFVKDLNLHVPKKLKRTKALVLAIYGPAFQQ